MTAPTTTPIENITIGSSTIPYNTTTATAPTTATLPNLVPVAAPAAPPVEPPAPPIAPPGAADDDKAKRSLADLIASLPEDDQKVVLDQVSKARDEAKGLRTRLKEVDPAKVRGDVLAEITKALGGTDQTPLDPATFAAQLAEQQGVAQQAQRELAVHRHAVAAGADPNAILDSYSFREAIKAIDPADGNAVTEAIKAAVVANPSLGLAATKRLPAPNPALGSSANGSPDLEMQIAEAQKRGDFAAVIHLQNQKLAAPTR